MNRYVLTILLALLLPAGLAIGSVPSAESVADSKNYLADRKAELLTYWANQELPEWQGWESGNSLFAKPSGPAKVHFPNIALAKLVKGEDLESIDSALAKAAVYSGVGSHVPLLRDGDYNFPLFILTAIAYEAWNSHELAPSTRTHLIKNLLNQEGPPQNPERIYGVYPETENHILMTEVSRYLKNQLVEKYGMEYRATDLQASAYNNETNGLRDFLIGYLKEIITSNFDEYNSKPYEVYTLSAIQALYEYAEDPDIKMAAQNVLDYHALRYALQSKQLRRVVPFRRQAKHLGLDHAYDRDAGAARYALLVGNHASISDTKKRELQSRARALPAVGDYEVPDAIKDLMISSAETPYLYWSFYNNAEIVHRDANFLISAGGIYHDKYRMPFFSHMDGLPRETVVMFKDGSPLISEMMRFKGAENLKKRSNTCVFAHFACGLHPQLPETLRENAESVIKSGEWLYLHVHDSYVALYRDEGSSKETPFGFLEIVDDSRFPSLADFKNVIEDRNKDREFAVDDNNIYTTSEGVEITFRISDDQDSGLMARIINFFRSTDPTWAIKGLENTDIKIHPQENLRQWPSLKAVHLGNGAVMARADDNGGVLVDNPRYQPPLSFGINENEAYRSHSTATAPAGDFWSD